MSQFYIVRLLGNMGVNINDIMVPLEYPPSWAAPLCRALYQPVVVKAFQLHSDQTGHRDADAITAPGA